MSTVHPGGVGLASFSVRLPPDRKTQSLRLRENYLRRSLKLIRDGFEGMRFRQRNQFAIRPHRPDAPYKFLRHDVAPTHSTAVAGSFLSFYVKAL